MHARRGDPRASHTLLVRARDEIIDFLTFFNNKNYFPQKGKIQKKMDKKKMKKNFKNVSLLLGVETCWGVSHPIAEQNERVLKT